MNSTVNPTAYQAFQEMTGEEWGELFKDLLAYTILLVRDRVWRQGLLPKGVTEEDLVQRLVKKTITGERYWDPDRIDLRKFLFSQIRSFVNHLFEYKEYIHETHTDETNDDLLEMIDKKMLENSEDFNPYTRNPENLFLFGNERAEEKASARKMVDAILEQCSDDTELEEVLYAVEELLEVKESVRAGDIADYLGVPREDIYNRIKRLKRRYKQAKIESMQAGN